MKLKDCMTRSEIVEKSNITVPGVYPIGIDYGFSGVKGIAPNKVFCYPNAALKIDSFASLMDSSDTDILLKDENGCWIIGEKASEKMSADDAMNYEDEMYGRNRYFSPIFQALMKAGLGIALASVQSDGYKGERIIVETGLPPKYREQDSDAFKEVLAGDYDFEMKLGKGKFMHYAFTIDSKDIYIMDQPMGSLFSAITKPDGTFSQDGRRILQARTLVFDPGFRTLDIYDISAGMFNGTNTFDTLGMYEVFKRTADDAKRKYGANITVPGMQNAMKNGFITAFDRKKLSSYQVNFEPILEKNLNDVCDEAIDKLLGLYNYLQDYEYLIIAGGTGEAWMLSIMDKFKAMNTLKILMANQNDLSLPNIYSNVRGYYFYLVKSLAGARR